MSQRGKASWVMRKTSLGNITPRALSDADVRTLISVEDAAEELRLGPASSPLGPWLDLLPAAGDAGALDLPLFWGPEDQRRLTGVSTRPITELAAEADEDFDWLEAEVFAPHRDAFPEEHFSREKWRRALGLALSRSFFLGGATRLVPFLDLANHDDDLRVEFKSSAEAGGGGGGGMLSKVMSSLPGGGKTARLVAGRAYEGGDEVCVSYGLRTSAEYLEEYGFVPFFNGARLRGSSSSPGEFGDGDLGEGLWASGQLAELTFALEEGVTRCHDDKADILEEAGLDVQATFEVSSSRAGEPDPAMVQFLRLLVLEGADLFLLEPVFRNECIDFMGLPVSEANERAVGALIIERCRAALAEMLTHAAYDAGAHARTHFVDKALNYIEERLSSRPIGQQEWRHVLFILDVFSRRDSDNALFLQVQAIAREQTHCCVIEVRAMRDAAWAACVAAPRRTEDGAAFTLYVLHLVS